MADGFDVVMTVNVPVSLDKATVAQLSESLESTLIPALSHLKSGHEVASELGLPTDVPVNFMVAMHAGSNGSSDAVPLRVAVRGGPLLVQEKLEVVEDKIGDMIYRALRTVEVPEDIRRVLGTGSKNGNAHFNLVFDDSAAQTMSVADLMEAAGCAPGSSYSWSKGCSSWPA